MQVAGRCGVPNPVVLLDHIDLCALLKEVVLVFLARRLHELLCHVLVEHSNRVVDLDTRREKS